MVKKLFCFILVFTMVFQMTTLSIAEDLVLKKHGKVFYTYMDEEDNEYEENTYQYTYKENGNLYLSTAIFRSLRDINVSQEGSILYFYNDWNLRGYELEIGSNEVTVYEYEQDIISKFTKKIGVIATEKLKQKVEYFGEGSGIAISMDILDIMELEYEMINNKDLMIHLIEKKPTEVEINLFPVRWGTKYGYIRANGQLALDFKYDGASLFSEEYAAVSINGKWGYIDNKGNIVINPVYEYAGDFNDGIAVVGNIDPILGIMQFSYINYHGDIINKRENFDTAFPFSEEYGIVYNGDLVGRVTQSGEILYYDAYISELNRYSDGFILTKDGNTNKYGYMDDMFIGWAIDPFYAKARDFSEKKAAVSSNGVKWGVY
ncbi:WG repeat-containing protein [Chengkuizengella axinellae]|uniref:WG repeat-containing protein n=1 Tax=Chengkuizengella axinellae TaxID=3064388 RepID=A0ABT9J7M9_9BACL|nr:WG repeat-containing protein [Chengkuizengella sp. 2205SS18-9]MDP5277005.1 WG repeat-containing protein [Chengkuizengella sp. 2205SS18-9]